MAKRNTIKNKLQRSKEVISIARDLKKKGIISKQAKLHGGKYISYNVLRKVNQFQHLQTHGNYRALKVTKDIARKAKEEGYQTIFGNRVIVPRDHDFIKRVKRGELSGIKPVRGGFMSEVTIPINAGNIQELISRLDKQTLDQLKLPGEVFAFSFHGHMSFRSFPDTKSFAQYLEHYKQDEKIKALKLFRLHPEDEPHYINASREHRKKTRAVRKRGRGESHYRSQNIENLPQNRQNHLRAQWAKKAQRKRERLERDPNALEAYREAARGRAKSSYANRKGKK